MRGQKRRPEKAVRGQKRRQAERGQKRRSGAGPLETVVGRDGTRAAQARTHVIAGGPDGSPSPARSAIGVLSAFDMQLESTQVSSS